MSKTENKNANRTNQIFNDLESYLNFCREFGYKYDESDLYSNRSYAYRQYMKFIAGKPVKDMWAIDAKSA